MLPRLVVTDAKRAKRASVAVDGTPAPGEQSVADSC
jgi:hypothetical protein